MDMIDFEDNFISKQIMIVQIVQIIKIKGSRNGQLKVVSRRADGRTETIDILDRQADD